MGFLVPLIPGKGILKQRMQNIRCWFFKKYVKHRPLVEKGTDILIWLTSYYLTVLVIALQNCVPGLAVYTMLTL